jgi:4-amino-4-deoxy-L-arabinose transferase-like glycosyltransferase
MEALALREPESPVIDHAGCKGSMRLKSILALGLVARLGMVWLVLTRFPRNWLYHEAPDLGFLAQSLRNGAGLSSPFGGSTGPSALVAPGYPTIIAIVFRAFGSYSVASAAAVMVLQTIFAILTIAVLMHVARRLFGVRAAELAGLIWAVSMPLLWLPTIFWDTSLSALLVIAMVALALRSVDRQGEDWLLIGAFSGMVMLMNPSLLLAIVTIFGWAAYQNRSHSRFPPFVGFLVLLAILGPWPIRNARLLHAFVPFRSSFGYELWQGNRAGADGIFDDSLYPPKNKQEFADYASNGEIAYMHEKSALAENYIRAHPREFVRVTLKRAARFWAGTGARENSGVVIVHVLATSLLGVVGLAILYRRRRPVAMLFIPLLLVFPLPYYITDIKFRYRLELDPILAILSAYTIVQILKLGKTRMARQESFDRL